MATRRRATKKAKKPVNFYVWLRSALRSLSRKWPPIFEALAAAKVPYKGTNKQRKVSYVCAKCKGEFSAKEVAVDHVVPVGSLLSEADIKDFILRLFCSKEDLQVCCHDCHSLLTFQQRYGVSEETAIKAKETIAFLKLPIQKQVAFLAKLGYNKQQCSNREKRKELFERNNKEK